MPFLSIDNFSNLLGLLLNIPPGGWLSFALLVVDKAYIIDTGAEDFNTEASYHTVRWLQNVSMTDTDLTTRM